MRHLENFDIRRDAGRHLGVGNGAHACAGQASPGWRRPRCCAHFIDRVDRICLSCQPNWAANNIIRRHRSLPVTLDAA
jgi:cytochrome P450